MFDRKRIWFRASSSALAALTTVFLTGQGFVQAHAASRGPQVRRSLSEVAATLKVPVEQLSAPDAFYAGEKARAAQRRLEGLAKARQFAKATEQEARAKQAQREADKVRNAPGAKLKREAAKAAVLKVPKDKASAAMAAAAPGFAPGKKGTRKHEAFAPQETKGPRFAPQAPRTSEGGAGGGSGRQGALLPGTLSPGALSPELRALYASLLGEDVEVPAEDGSVVSVLQALAGVERRPSQLASAGWTDVGAMLPLLGALPAPASEDLAQTPETRLTPEIVALAQKLGPSALAAYNYVHTQVVPELYYGSKKGAHGTLMEGAGNDFDQAALLIALLRASNIPARYEYGTVRLNLAQAQALTGAADATQAAYLLAQSGVPAGIGADRQTVLVERAWVRAYVPYGDYRGTGPGGESIWVRLDAGLKRVDWSTGVDLKGLVTFDEAAYLSHTRAETPAEVFEGQLLAAARAGNRCNTLDAALSKAKVAPDAYRLLPAEHPAKVEQSLLFFARPPAQFRFSIEVVVDGQTHAMELAEAQYRKLGLRYVGATATDEAAIAAAGGIENVVPYQVQVAPVLTVDGVEVKRFRALMPGLTQPLLVKSTVPGGSQVVAKHSLVAGSVYALSVAAGNGSAAYAKTLAAQVPGVAAAGASNPAQDEAYGHAALAWYTQAQGASVKRLFALQGHGTIQDVQEGLAGRELKVTEFMGTPVGLAQGDYFIDFARDSLTPIPKDGDRAQVVPLMRLAGLQGSALEHKVWETLFAVVSYSAVKVLQAAAEQQVPVYTLAPGSSSQRSLLTGFSDMALADIDNALGAGWTVKVPQRPINYAQYTGVEGYTLFNPLDGRGAYKINRLLNGGGSGGPPGAAGPQDCPTCNRNTQTVGSEVDLANGVYRTSETDLTLPAIGLPIVWTRTYASKSSGQVGLGYGWMHPYGVFLRAEANGDVTYVSEDWTELRFKLVSGAYVAPAGWYLTLTNVTGGGKRLRTKDGLTRDFDAAGKLTQLGEPSGNTVQLVYSNGLLSQVKDSNGQVALTLSYGTGVEAGKVTQVTDRAGRSVRYGYAGDGLVSATDVLGHSEGYGYDGFQRLVSKTDKLGHVSQNLYDTAGRWVGGRDALGFESSAFYDIPSGRTVYVDKTGAAWTSYHNASGNPVAKVDPLGNRQEFTWNNQQKLAESDGRGYVTSYTYDAKGNVLTVTQPDGRVTTRTYEATFSRMLTEASTGLPTVTSTYDTAGRLKTRTDGLGTTTYNYDGRGQLSSVVAPGNSTTSFVYDGQGTVTRVTDPTSKVTTLSYDTAGHLTSMTDGNNHTRGMEVNAEGQVTAMVDAAGVRTEFVYDDAGRRVSVKDAASHVTAFEYDALGRMTKTTDALGNVARTEYDAEGRVVATVDAKGARSVVRYDAAGKVTERVAADGSTSGVLYCADVPQPCAQVDALGNVTTTEFDSAGRVTQSVDALGRVAAQTYDTAGRVKTSSGPGNVPVTYTYAFSGLLNRVDNPVLSISYGYDARGNRTSVNAGGQTTSYTYDLANRLLTETNPLGKVTSFTYDAAGNRATKTDGNGKLTTYSYDSNRRLTQVLFHDGTKYQYGYDTRGNRTLEKGPSHERQLAYDALGRVAQVDDVTLGRTLAYGYDANGNRTSVADAAAGLLHSYAYDAVNRLRRASDAGTSGTNAVFLAYDALGRRQSVTRPNGVRTDYSYDGASQVTGIVHSKAGQVLLGFGYQYDELGNRLSKTREDGSAETYGYDSVMRLTRAEYGPSRNVVYGLDALGNRTSLTETLRAANGTSTVRTVTSTNNAFNQLTRAVEGQKTTNYSYDFNGNLLSEVATFPGTPVTTCTPQTTCIPQPPGVPPQCTTTNVCTTTTPTVTETKGYTWNADNRLVQVTMPSGAVHAYQYDANGLRTRKVEAGMETRFLLDEASVVEELDGSGNIATSYLTNPHVIDEILAFRQGGQDYFPLTDALGSLYAITDSTGAVVRTNSYDVYGERSSVAGTGPQLAFGFTGREHDASGLRYHRDRYADAVNGRWSQPDRLGRVDGPHLYQYATSRPTVFSDPLGKWINVERSWRDQLAILNEAIATNIGWRFYFYLFNSGTEVIFLGPESEEMAGPFQNVYQVGLTRWLRVERRLICYKAIGIAVRPPFRGSGLFPPGGAGPVESSMVHEMRHAIDFIEQHPDLGIPEKKEARGYAAGVVAEMEWNGGDFKAALRHVVDRFESWEEDDKRRYFAPLLDEVKFP